MQQFKKLFVYLNRMLILNLRACLLMAVALEANASLRAQLNIDMAIALGKDAIYHQDYKGAIEHFDEVIMVRPHVADAHYFRAYANYSLKKYKEAENDCNSAINNNPFHPEFFQLRGLCRLNLSKYQESADDYSKVLEIRHCDLHSLYNRAVCNIELKNLKQVEADIDSITRFYPDVYRIHLLSAQMSLLDADTLKAIAHIDTLISHNSIDSEALAFRGRLCVWEENYQRADSFITLAINRGGRIMENYIVRAQARHALNRYNDALADYSEAILLSPRSFVAHYNRGLLRALVGADNLAIEDFDFVLRVDSTNTLALYNRAMLRERTGDYVGAEADYTLLISDYPTFYAGYASRARCRHKLGKTVQARADESVVSRAELDMLFNSKKRKNGGHATIRNVRSLSQEDLDYFQRLLDIEAEEGRKNAGLPPDFLDNGN